MELLARARRLWSGLAQAPVTFHGSVATVVVSPQSLLCPPGWVGIVALGDAAIATAPDEATAERVRQRLAGLPVASMTDPANVPAREVLGPATLAYCDPVNFQPAALPRAGLWPAGPQGIEVIPADLGDLLARVSDEDAGECGLDEITSSAYVVRAGNEVIAAAGFRAWPDHTAHLSVLTRPDHRGRGLARVVASAAVADALRAGMLAQWRARPEASRRVARSLGFTELGSQLSVTPN